MCHRTIVFAVVFTGAALTQGQKPNVGRPSGLRLSANSWQELGPEDRIEVSKELKPADRDLLAQTITSILRAETEDFTFGSEQQLLEGAKQTRIHLADLNGDGKNEVIAQASGDILCSPTGNCSIWVLQRADKGYRLILKANAIQTFAIQPGKTNGFQDLVLGMHGSATEQELFVYRFVNDRYRRSACYDANWERLVGDKYVELKSPIVTPYPCGGKKKP
jgi:hypothetical protein